MESFVVATIVGAALVFVVSRARRRLRAMRQGTARCGCCDGCGRVSSTNGSPESVCSDFLRPRPQKKGGAEKMKASMWCVVMPMIAVCAAGVRAADTTEAWEAGASDVEFYLGADGIGLEPVDRSLYSTLVVGFGAIDRLSTTH